MSFFCAGSNSSAVKKKMKSGSKPGAQPVSKSSSNGHVANPFQADNKKSLPTIPFADQPNTRRMMVIQEYCANDDLGLSVQRGEQVQVLNQDGNWYYVRNESKKEGFVPSSHLFAPYSSTRTGRMATTNPPMRPIQSNTTVRDQDPNRGVAMYPSHSAGVPWSHDDHVINRANSYNRGSSPRLVVNENNNNMAHNGVTMYEQKHSPSSSSGVASMNGPSSPSFQSLPENYSQDMGHRSSGSSLTQERNSLSSIEENGMEPHNGYSRYPNEEIGMRSHRATSESNIMHMQARPLPHPPSQPDQEGVYLDKRMNHIYSTITNGEGPPPIPPRDRPPMMPMSNSQPYGDTDDQYIAPADAVLEQPGPHLDRPRVRSLSDVRSREGYRPIQSSMDYSEVYDGKIRKPHRQNGYHHTNDSASEHSEGGSSNRSSSRKGSSSRRAHVDPIAGSREFVPQESRQLTHIPAQSAATRILKFRKCLWGVFVVTVTFESQDENELSVYEGEHVSVWNQDDQDWFWIVKHSTSEEGFVPSRFLKEVSSEAQHSSAAQQAQQLPPIPPKKHSSNAHPDSQFRQRSSSHESRSTNQTARSRGRLNSDGSSRSRSSLKANHSVTSIENMEIPESPPNTPPPPYSEFDQPHPHASRHHQPHSSYSHNPPPTRHYSLSQQHEASVHHGNTAPMQRTRSQGYVTRKRYGTHPTPPMQRYLSPPEQSYNHGPPAAANDGTLV